MEMDVDIEKETFLWPQQNGDVELLHVAKAAVCSERTELRSIDLNRVLSL